MIVETFPSKRGLRWFRGDPPRKSICTQPSGSGLHAIFDYLQAAVSLLNERKKAFPLAASTAIIESNVRKFQGTNQYLSATHRPPWIPLKECR